MKASPCNNDSWTPPFARRFGLLPFWYRIKYSIVRALLVQSVWERVYLGKGGSLSYVKQISVCLRDRGLKRVFRGRVRANDPFDFYPPPPSSSSPVLESCAAPKWLPAWLNVMKNGRALPPNLTGIFLYKKAREREREQSDESNFSASYNSKLSTRLNRDSPRFIIRLAIYSWFWGKETFFFFLFCIYITRD